MHVHKTFSLSLSLCVCVCVCEAEEYLMRTDVQFITFRSSRAIAWRIIRNICQFLLYSAFHHSFIACTLAFFRSFSMDSRTLGTVLTFSPQDLMKQQMPLTSSFGLVSIFSPSQHSHSHSRHKHSS